MAQRRVVILDHTRSKKTTVELPDDIPVRRLLPALTARMGLPQTMEDGRAIVYLLDHKASGRRLAEDETLADAGVDEDDSLSLLPEVTAGGGTDALPPPEKLNVIDDILDAMADLRSRSLDKEEIDRKLDGLLAQVSDDNSKRYAELLREIQRERQDRIAVGKAIRIKADVEVPTPEQMKVKLVAAHLLTWLEETRSDESRWSSAGWAFVGAIMGLVVNWITAEEFHVSRPAVVILLAFAVIAVLAFGAAHRYSRRGQKIRSDMMTTGVPAESHYSLGQLESDHRNDMG